MRGDRDEIARVVTSKIEDAYCQHYDGGRAQRFSVIQALISDAMKQFWDERLEMASRIDGFKD